MRDRTGGHTVCRSCRRAAQRSAVTAGKAGLVLLTLNADALSAFDDAAIAHNPAALYAARDYDFVVLKRAKGGNQYTVEILPDGNGMGPEAQDAFRGHAYNRTEIDALAGSDKVPAIMIFSGTTAKPVRCMLAPDSTDDFLRVMAAIQAGSDDQNSLYGD